MPMQTQLKPPHASAPTLPLTLPPALPTLLAQGLVLRAFEPRDAAEFAEASRESADSVGVWLPWCHAGYTAQDSLDWFEHCWQDLASGEACEFGIFCGDTGQLLGGCGLSAIQTQHRVCNLGYWVRQSAQRQGIALRAVQALAHFGLSDLGLMRLEIVIAAGNRASEGLARKAGALFEGVAQNRLLIHGASLPAAIYSLLP